MAERLLFMLFLLIGGSFAYAQYTHDSFEKYIFHPYFQAQPDNGISAIIEEDEESQIIRKWIFDDKGRLSKELDFRERGISASIDGDPFSSLMTNYQDYVYNYGINDELKEVIQTEVQNGDTLRIVHKFDYSRFNVVKESYSVKKGALLDMDLLKTTVSSKGFKESVTNVSITHGISSYVESKSKTFFRYNDKNQIKEEISYFKINTYPLQEKKKPEPYRTSTIREFNYDREGRLYTILEYAYDEDGQHSLNKKVQFFYKEGSPKIIGFQIQLGASYNLEVIEATIAYDFKGNLNRIESKYGKTFYKFEKRKQLKFK